MITCPWNYNYIIIESTKIIKLIIFKLNQKIKILNLNKTKKFDNIKLFLLAYIYAIFLK